MNRFGRFRLLLAVLVLPFSSTVATALEQVELVGGSVVVGNVLEHSETGLIIQLVDGPLLEVRADQVAAIKDLAGALQFAGSNTVGERLIPAMVETYARERGAADLTWEPSPEANESRLQLDSTSGDLPSHVEIRAHGSSTAYPALSDRSADIGMSSRPIRDDEATLLATLGDMRSPDAEHIIALDGIAIIVHPDNPINALSKEEIAQLFACEKDWQEVGGDPGAVNIYARDAKSGTYDTFESLVLKPFGLALCDQASRIESSSDLAEMVGNDPQAIGFISLGYKEAAKALAIKECSWAYTPSTFSVKTEEYPLARRLYLYAPLQSVSPWARDFVDFALSDDAQQVVRDIDFVDLSIDSTGEVTDAYRLAKVQAAAIAMQQSTVTQSVVGDTMRATRLTATFRFRSGIGNLEDENALDNRALRDLDRLARFLDKPLSDGQELLLFGFADATGDYDANLALSEARASAVANKLATRGINAAFVKGFGEEAPVACNDRAVGRERNRRVEVWLRPNNDRHAQAQRVNNSPR